MNCMGASPDQPVTASGQRYEASPKHCEPVTAQRPGTKCPKWAGPIAQSLLDLSEEIGENKRVATCRGVAFIARKTHPDGNVWHGYPEAWDKIPGPVKERWLDNGWITRRDLRTWKTERDIANVWRECLDDR